MYSAAPVPQTDDIRILIRYLYSEFKRIEQELKNPKLDYIQWKIHYSDQDFPHLQDGLTAFFKPDGGTQTKDGLYTYNNGVWNPT